MSVINTNVSATLAANAIARNDRSMATSMERLSTGLRINSAKDDAAGLAIANRMAGQISGLNMAKRNGTRKPSKVRHFRNGLLIKTSICLLKPYSVWMGGASRPC